MLSQTKVFHRVFALLLSALLGYAFNVVVEVPFQEKKTSAKFTKKILPAVLFLAVVVQRVIMSIPGLLIVPSASPYNPIIYDVLQNSIAMQRKEVRK